MSQEPSPLATLVVPRPGPVTPLGSRTEEPRASTTRAEALICKNLFGEPSPLLAVGGLELVRTLGRGGRGIVYEALDPRRDERVALKMLHGQHASDLYALKREFRALAALHHPNLVSLYELSVARRHAYFTMELVRGSDFVSYVRAGTRAGARIADEARLRAALAQLCEAVHTLHQAGKLHRDLKPSNILVTAAGRVVLLDFGLVRDLHERCAPGEGTPAYMAPEQARGAASTASDWYSFGLVLRHALLGQLHQRGSAPGFARVAGDRVRAPHVEGCGSSAREQRDEAESELEQLASRLLSADPAARPSYLELRATLAPLPAHFLELTRARALSSAPRSRDEPPRLTARAPELLALARASGGFVGRATELAVLDDAFGRSRSEPVLLVIRGDSGVGKTALVRHFVEVRLAPHGALVLRGRCYERESVPFKALDNIIDELCCRLLALPEAVVAGLRPVHAGALIRLFPVLARVPALRSQPGAHKEIHPVELRTRAFGALKSLLRSLAASRPLVLCIDDIQWADADSGRLLAALLCAEDAVPLLILGNDRTDSSQVNPTLAEYERVSELALRPLPIAQLTLRPLPPDEAAELARSLLGREARASTRELLVERVAAESAGNPLLLTELARWLSGHTCAALREREHASLDALFTDRFGALDAQSRRVLELLAVAGRPLPASVVTHAAGFVGSTHTTLRALRASRLVHITPRGPDELLELDHDRVGEALTADMEPAVRHALFRRLARAFEASPGARSDTLVEQYLGAQLPHEAARHARRAADSALATLAFLRAAWLYEQALTLGDYDPAEQALLYGDLARALEHAGKGLEAAAAYQRAAALRSDSAESALLEERAAHHLLLNGECEQGLALLRQGYRRLGLPWPRTRLFLMLAVLFQLVSSPLRRLGLWPTRTSPRQHGVRAQLLALAGAGLEGVDTLRAVYNALLCFDAADQSGDEVWRKRSAAGRGFMRCASLAWGGAARGFREQESACAWAAAHRQGHALADLLSQLALAHGLRGQPRAALETATRCEAELRRLPPVPFDRYVVVGVVGNALLELGELREARRRWASYTHEARLHGDLMSSFWIHAHPVHFAILFAADDRESARIILERQQRLCRRHPSYKVLVWAHTICAAEVLLYWGEAGAAERLVSAEWSALSGSGYPFMTELSLLLRARACLAAAAPLPRSVARARLLRGAARAIRALCLRGGRARPGQVELLRAGLALQRQQRGRALTYLERALWLFDASESKLVAASARYCQGALEGGEAGWAAQDAALACLKAEGVADPARWIVWNAPGLEAPESPPS